MADKAALSVKPILSILITYHCSTGLMTNWKDLEEMTGEQIYYPTGILYNGTEDHTVMQGVERSASLHSLSIEKLGGPEISKRFPAFKTNYAIYEKMRDPSSR
jgi:hypothetical protein